MTSLSSPGRRPALGPLPGSSDRLGPDVGPASVARRLLLALAALAALLAGLQLGPVPARAADYGPGYDGPAGRIGAYVFEGSLVYCLEPQKDRPLGATTAAGTADGARFAISDADMARLNWAISTRGQTADPDVATAVAMFVWSTVAFADYMSHGMHGDEWYLGRVPADHRGRVLEVLRELRAGAAAVGAPAGRPAAELRLTADRDDPTSGSVSLEVAEAGASAQVTLEHAVFASSGAATGRLAAGETAPIRATPAAIATGSFRVRATALVERPAQEWSARVAVFETPGAQLLGGAGGSSEGSFPLEARDAADRVPSFSPVVTTSVSSRYADGSGPLIDRWTIGRVGEAPWLRRLDGTAARVLATATLYGPFDSEPVESGAVPAGAPVAAVVDVPLGGGAADPTGTRVEVSTATARTPVGELPPGWYTWVAEIRADRQPAGDGPAVLPPGYAWRDAFGLRAETLLVTPSVRTEAQPEAAPGEPIRDTAIIDGVLPDGATLAFELFPEARRDGTPICEAPLAATAAVPVPAGRHQGLRLESASIAAPAAPGAYWWIETLRAADGTVLARGECGEASETTRVVPEQTATPEPTQAPTPSGEATPSIELATPPTAPAPPTPISTQPAALAETGPADAPWPVGVVGGGALAAGLAIRATRGRGGDDRPGVA